MRELSLFTGAGGGLLGTHLLGWEPCGYVEWNSYCQQVIAARIRDGYLPVAPIFTDVREFVQSGAAEQYRCVADVVTAGFPCQPFSVAGKQRAADDERNMWPATREVIRRVQPRSVLLENVPGLVSCGYIGTVLSDLAALGYVGRWGVLGAADAGAPHKRDRLWIVAHTDYAKRRAQREACDRLAIGPDGIPQGQEGAGRFECGSSDVAYAERCRSEQRPDLDLLGRWQGEAEQTRMGGGGGYWKADPANDPESGVGRVANGVAHRVDRLKALGNGQVSAVVARAWQELAA